MDKSAERKKFWRQTIKARAIEAFGGVCFICGKIYDDCCYDFHHIDATEKEMNISVNQFNGAKSWLKIRDELRKCVLVCANCHRMIHSHNIEIEKKQYFNEDYYEWELANAKQVSQDLTIIDVSHVCPVCGKTKTGKAELCAECSLAKQKRFDVSRDELKSMIRTMHFTKIGEIYGVSDNAIRKRCKSMNLPSKKSDIKKISDEDWEKI